MYAHIVKIDAYVHSINKIIAHPVIYVNLKNCTIKTPLYILYST